MESPSALSKLQQLLAGLFQFDLSDLDFGIYRLFRLKRDELEKFIGEQIPRAVEEAFAEVAGEDTAKLKAEVADLAQKIREELEVDAILEDGSLNPKFDKATIGKTVRLMVSDYEVKRDRLRGLIATENQKDDVFNHLHAFFSRYYDRGDFIPRRFFGARSHYAVPYNGEETHFHWANKDQHYIKTGEAFRDYSFVVADILGGPARVRFALTKANLPPGDTKGDRRYFFPQAGESAWDEKTRTLTIPFHYRLPVDAELKTAPVEENGESGEAEAESGGKPKKISGDKLQDKLLADALDALLAACPDAGLADALRRVVNAEQVAAEGKPPVSYLAQRMRHFARRQTSDYFVHKNLAAFLREELDFYIRDQVVHVADLEGDFEGKRRMLRALRRLAGDLIEFLHHIEEVQRRLFEKRKFVLRTDYLCPVQNVPRALWKDICTSKAQLKEWQDIYALGKDGAGEGDLFAFKGKLTESFLENHPTLVVNTALFDEEFKWRMLEGLDNLDEMLDGVLVKSENFQGLRTLAARFRERFHVVYADPPYNTGKDEFLYKDTYRHSCWVAAMDERLGVLRQIARPETVFFTSIDSNEMTNLSWLLDARFGPQNHLGDIVWKSATDNNPTRVAVEHEYVLCYAKDQSAVAPEWKSTLSTAKEILLAKYDELKAARLSSAEIQKEIREFIRDNLETVGELDRYKFVDDDGIYTGSESVHNPHPGGYRYDIPHETTGKPMRIPSNGYRFPWETMKRDFIDKKRLIYGPDENRIVKIKIYLRDYQDSLRSVVHLDGRLGSYALTALFGADSEVFKNPKAPELIERLISFAAPDDGMVADITGGSGTTAQAVIDLNRQAGTARKFVVFEMSPLFDKVIIPRVQKVAYSSAWKDGKPMRLPNKDETGRTPRLVKVLRLESYEDALHNLATDATLAASEAKAAAFKDAVGAETYCLRYLARLPLEASASMLQTERLDHPFRYALEVLTDDGAEPCGVDLVETFNWLLGLDVRRVRRWEHAKREYRTIDGRDRAGRRVLVVWRDTDGLDPIAERTFLEKKVEELTKDTAPFDTMLANGDCAVPGFASLDGLFKQLMEAV
jgi:adenine-specific DNA-methyltransferase